MTSGPAVPMRKPEPDLDAARAHVLAIVNGSAMARRAPTVVSEWPLRPLPPELRATLAGAAGASSAPAAAGRRSPAAVAGPATAFAALDAVFVIVGFATGRTALAVGALVLFLLFAGVAVLARRGAAGSASGAARNSADRRAVAAAGRWSSNRPWTGDVGNGPERGVVLAAADAAQRIGRAPAYRAAILGGQAVLDVLGELDRIDDEAYRVATLRRTGDPHQGAQAEDAWSAVLTRAAALTAYAEALDGLDRSRVAAMARQNDALREAGLLTDPASDRGVDDALTTLLVWYGSNAGSGM